ncbi:DUF2834 domain-containing protein [Rhodoglobus vestalii]|uniref:DUF2834 domain-containing protein n=1 Tax=Rhodoglobus vestalii TaxID=193384 RepID=UPI00319DEDA6
MTEPSASPSAASSPASSPSDPSPDVGVTSPTAVRDRPSLLRHWNATAVTFAILAILGLVGTWIFNILAIVQMRDFLGDWFGSGPAVNSLGVDLLVVAVAGSILIIIEARRLGMKRAWLYIVLSGITAFAFTFPLFLAMRERKLVELGRR